MTSHRDWAAGSLGEFLLWLLLLLILSIDHNFIVLFLQRCNHNLRVISVI